MYSSMINPFLILSSFVKNLSYSFLPHFLLSFAFCTAVYSQTESSLTMPRLAVGADKQSLSLSWESVAGATGYRLYYAPYPYQGEQTVAVLDMGNSLSINGELPEGSSYLVAVEAYNATSSSPLSNVEYFILDNDHIPFTSAAGSFYGLTLISPITDKNTYLIDDFGDIKHQWQNDTSPGLSVYLLPSGNLLRTGNDNNGHFDAGGKGGFITEQDWDGNLLWEFTYSDEEKALHHDIELLPNGNILALTWEDRGDIWSEVIIEIEKTGSSGGNIVWRWDVFDHLSELGLDPDTATMEDWIHLNSVDYNQASNQILVSSRSHNQLWIINKDDGSVAKMSSVEMTGQHDAKWIDDTDASSTITVYDNGSVFSRSLELNPNMGKILFRYGNNGDNYFFSERVSGTQRLSNGNTLICSGNEGRIVEVDAEGNKVREYFNTYGGTTPMGTVTGMFRAEKYPTGYTPYF